MVYILPFYIFLRAKGAQKNIKVINWLTRAEGARFAGFKNNFIIL